MCYETSQFSHEFYFLFGLPRCFRCRERNVYKYLSKHPSVGKVKLCARMRVYVLCTSTEVCTVKWEGDKQVTVNPRATLLKLELFDFPLRHRFVYYPVPFYSLLIKTISSLKAFMRHRLIISWLILFIKDVPSKYT